MKNLLSKFLSGFTVLMMVMSIVGPVNVARAAHDPFESETQSNITICHYVNGHGGSYTNNTVSVSSSGAPQGGHDGHDNDIIPPYHWEDGETIGEYPGKNWDEDAEILWNLGGCNGEGEIPEPETIVGCTDEEALNFNPDATEDTIPTSCEYEPPQDPETDATISATKIVCPTEDLLPNWGEVEGEPTSITATTAAEFLLANPTCSLEDWTFEWAHRETPADAVGNTPNPGDNVGVAGGDWTPFATTVFVNTTEHSKVWVREQMMDGYVPFSGSTFQEDDVLDDVSAEFYCNNDTVNYDNYDFIDGLVAGETYHCIGFNALDEVLGCTDETASNFDQEATENDGSCTYVCMDPQLELLTSGGFETPTVTDGALWDIFPTGTPGLAWVVEWLNPSGAPDIANVELQENGLGGGWLASEGTQWTELDSDWQGPGGTSGESGSVEISQDVVTKNGVLYTVSFDFSARPNQPAPQNKVEVYADGNLIGTVGPTAGVATTAWTSHSFSFLADGPLTTIAFRDAGTPSDTLGTFIDNASVKCVEEDPPPPLDLCLNLQGNQSVIPEGYTLVSEGQCEILGCTDESALNYNPEATQGDHSCEYEELTCEEETWNDMYVSDTDTMVGENPAVLLSSIHAAWNASIPGASWIWSTDPVVTVPDPTTETEVFIKTFSVVGTPTGGSLMIAADNTYSVTLNGETICTEATITDTNFSLADQDTCAIEAEDLITGFNTLEFTVTNEAHGNNPASNPAGLMYKLSIDGNECVPPPVDACPNEQTDPGIQTSTEQCFVPPQMCTDESANNYGGPLPCDYNEETPNDSGGGGASGGHINRSSGQVLGAATDICNWTTVYLRRNWGKNTRDNVQTMQNFLNLHMNSGLVVDSVFGPKTEAAVNAFQNKYSTDILIPWGITKHTGIWYISTTTKAKEIMCGAKPPLPTLINWSKNPEVR